MPNQICTGAMMTCAMGMAPSSFIAIRPDTLTSMMPAGVITDNVPFENIPPFGMCTSPANPAVAAATAAALGVLTPMPCVPVFPAPWVPGIPTLLIDSIPAIDDTCTLMCAYGGVVTFSFAGQATHQIP